MTYSYDSHGWFSPVEIPNRATEVAPPSHGAAPVVGQPWPNWTGVEWVMIAYVEPVTPTPPAQPRLLSVLSFRSRFTDAEKIAIYTAAETSIPVRVWLDDLSSAQDVDVSDPRIIAGVSAMEFGGLIAAGRAAVILA